MQLGNRSSSSACGSADVLEALGVAIDLEPEVGFFLSIKQLIAETKTERCRRYIVIYFINLHTFRESQDV